MKNENTKTRDEIEHPSVRESLKFLDVTEGLEIQHTADLPAMSGLGSSSAFTVGLLHALYLLEGTKVSKRELIKDAIHVEQECIKENVGSQDQVATAVGGFNRIDFSNTSITVTSVKVPGGRLQELEDCLLLFFTGFSRNASDVAAEQVKNIAQKHAELTRMCAMVDEGVRILESNRSLDEFGKLLHEAWLLKRSLSSVITNRHIDEIYEKGRAAGALGGKLLGAGNGGFMLFFVPKDKRSVVRVALKELLCVPFHFEEEGSQVLYERPSEKYEIFEA